MILNKIANIDVHLRPNQNGFRARRSTTAHTSITTNYIRSKKEYNIKGTLTFIDFCKAFDSVNKKRMFEILSAYRIPRRIVNAIKKMYEDTKAKVVSPGGETETYLVFTKEIL